MTIEFRPWPKIPRLFRNVIVTEKIDGTNAAVVVTHAGDVYAQSRKRFITPEDDNYGFAAWAYQHAGELAETLGQGYHFGEWWGKGIQRGYGLDGRRFSLFNPGRWAEEDLEDIPGLHVVPVLARHTSIEVAVGEALDILKEHGSQAAPGFDRPEGVVAFHTGSRQTYKATFEADAPESVPA